MCANLCDHLRLKRLDNNFVRCLDCGQSIISQKNMIYNKTSKDFSNENKTFTRNFNRNFTNVLEEVDEESTKPVYEYYTDRIGANNIVVNKVVQFSSDPAKFEVIVNGTKHYLTNDEIKKLLSDINAIKVDRNQSRGR